METIIIKTIAILSLIAMFVCVARIDATFKKAKIEETIKLQIFYTLILFGVIISALSGYILLFV